MRSLVYFIGLFILASVFTEKSVAREDSILSTTTPLDGFEKEGSWIVEYSLNRCKVWDAGEISNFKNLPTPEQTTNNTPTQETDTNNTAPEPVSSTEQNTTTPEPNNSESEAQNKSETPDDAQSWLKWIKSTDIAGDSTGVLPIGIPKQYQDAEKTILAVKGCWNNRGNNWIRLTPKEPLYTPENPNKIGVWVWSTVGQNYDLYATVQNLDGLTYTLYLGNLAYNGWRNLVANIPKKVTAVKVNSDNRLQIVSLKIEANNSVRPRNFYVYFDFMQIRSDISTNRFNGDALVRNYW